MAGHYPGVLMTGHRGTNTPKFVYPLAGDDRALTLLKRGCANWVVGLEHVEVGVVKEALIRADFWEGDATKHFSVKKKRRFQ